MFEKFPQLWRLERMLSKAQSENFPSVGFNTTASPTPRMKKSRDFFRRKIKHDAFDEISMVFDKKGGRSPSRTLNLYDSDDLTGFKKPMTKSKASGQGKLNEKSTVRTPSNDLSMNPNSPQYFRRVCSRGPHTECTTNFSSINMEDKRAILRTMQELQPSDLYNVLSDEENEEYHEECRRPCRYPLPTMPLAIMIPASNLPIEISPLDLAAVSQKIAKFDESIDGLLETRNRLASCFELFDDLCTSFRGPQNLDCFLRSLISRNSFKASRKGRAPRNGVLIRSKSVVKKAKKELFSSVPPEKSDKDEDSNFCGSRLLRPTISTQMKHIDVRNKDTTRDVIDLPPRQTAVTKKQSESTTTKKISNGVTTKKSQRTRSRRISNAPFSDEDAREDMLLRVRRNLMRMPWMGRSRKGSSNRAIAAV